MPHRRPVPSHSIQQTPDLTCIACGQGADKAGGKFARTGHAMRLMERVGVAMRQQEPCLLVGETGTGKTALVQQLASQASSACSSATMQEHTQGAGHLRICC